MGLCQYTAKCTVRIPFIWKFRGDSFRYSHQIYLKRVFSSVVEKSEVVDGLPFEQMPGPKSNRFLGTLPKYLPLVGEYSMDTLHKNAFLNYQRYGRLVRERITPSVSLVHVFAPGDMEAVFRSEGRHPERRSHLALAHYRALKPDVYSTGGLLSTNGPEWWRLRSSFQKHLTSPQSVRNYVAKTDLVAQEFASWVQQRQTQGDIDDFLPLLNRLFLETISYVAFDLRLNSFSPEEQEASSRSSKIILAAFESNSGILRLDHGFLWRFFNTPLYRKMSKSQEYLEKFSTDLLANKLKFFQAARQERPNENASLLDLFLHLPNVDMKDIVGMMVDILMAAIDTTSYSTSFLLYHLARNANSQRSLFKECLELLPQKDSCVTSEIISKAVYAKSCIRESLRLNPVSVGVGRVLQKDVVLSGYHVPKGTVVVTQNMVSSRLHQYCDTPSDFKPERWLRNCEKHESINPFLSLPFGFGPRSCIARRLAEQTMCVNLLKMVRHFRLDWLAGELDVKTLLINKPDGPVQLRMTARNI